MLQDSPRSLVQPSGRGAWSENNSSSASFSPTGWYIMKTPTPRSSLMIPWSFWALEKESCPPPHPCHHPITGLGFSAPCTEWLTELGTGDARGQQHTLSQESVISIQSLGSSRMRKDSCSQDNGRRGVWVAFAFPPQLLSVSLQPHWPPFCCPQAPSTPPAHPAPSPAFVHAGPSTWKTLPHSHQASA